MSRVDGAWGWPGGGEHSEVDRRLEPNNTSAHPPAFPPVSRTRSLTEPWCDGRGAGLPAWVSMEECPGQGQSNTSKTDQYVIMPVCHVDMKKSGTGPCSGVKGFMGFNSMALTGFGVLEYHGCVC